MKLAKKIISIMLVFLLTFTGENIFLIGKAFKFNTYAETTLETDINYDNFSDTSGLQINGTGLVANDLIEFESNGTGESIFTSEKIQLGADYSFSTSFSFRNISPSELNSNTAGGFTFTLQPLENTLTSNNLENNIFNENFSIGFISKYTDGPISAKSINNNILQVASISDLYLSSIPYAKCEIYYSPYIAGLEERVLSSYITTNETSEFFKVWIGYDGTEKKLETLILDDLGNYNHIVECKDLTDILDNEVYAGFMGSMGNAKNINEISEWHFRSDLSLIDDILIQLDVSELVNQMDMSEDPKEINSNLYLSTEGGYGSSISWESSDITAINEDGTVNTPGINEDPKEATLTATISRGKAEDIVKTFNYIVTASDSTIIDADYSWLEYKEILNKNYEKNRIFSDLDLSRSGKYGSDINWISSNPTYLDAFGKVTNPSLSEGNQNVILTATISKGVFSQEKEFDFTVIAELNDSDIIHADLAWLNEEILNGNSDLRNVTTDLSFPSEGQNGSSISWQSSNPEYIDTNGKVNRPAYDEGDKEVILTATISYGSETITRDFFILVKAMGQSDEGKVQHDLEWLSEERILNGNTDINNIVKNLYLPTRGEKESIISWESSDLTAIDTNGLVNRPKYLGEDKTVTLTATVTSGSISDSKIFNLIVKAEEATDEDRVNNDSIWLDEDIILKDNSGLDNVMTELYLPTIGLHESNISWYSSNTTVIDTNGRVNRPSYLDGNANITLTATIEYGLSTITKIFQLKVKAIAITDEDKVQDDLTWLDEKIILDKNTDLSNITTKLYFPSEGPNKSTISWESNNTNFVSNEGIVVRPIFIQGDQTVDLTATLSSGEYKLSKTFTLIVKVGYLSDEMTVSNDLSLLDEQKIKNQNIDLNNVTSDLTLPTRGDYGSYIRWESSDIEVVSIEGKVNRPKFTEEEKVLKLTAFVSFNSVEDSKEFTITVKPLEGIDEELIEADSLWLEKVILKENSDLNNIMTDLYLPSEGKYKSNIEWYSSYPEFIDMEGKVNRPTYSQGDRNFSLVATITKGSKITVKPFLVAVKKQTLTVSEALKEDLDWFVLNRYYILDKNTSEYSVTSDLLFPNSPPNGSTITWISDRPEIISNTGVVNRPENGEGHKLVTVTATLSLESETISENFKYTVLEIPEGDPPKVISTSPVNNSKDVSWDTKEVEIIFDEDIIGANGIEFIMFNNKYVIADIYENTMSFSSENLFVNGENKVFIPAATVKDKHGNLNEEYEFTFTMDEKVKKTINIISSNPANLYSYFPLNDATINLKFDETNLKKGEKFDNISLISKNYLPHEKGVDIEATLDRNSINIKVKEKLYHGLVYELVIPQGTLTDQYENTNKENILQFRTAGIGSPSTIKSIYPYNNQFDVSINQDIEIIFSTPEVLHSNLLVLKDHTGKVYNSLKSKTPIPKDTTRHTISVALEPNKNYTLSGPYSMEGSSELSFEISFRTGDNSLPIVKTCPIADDMNCAINDDIIIEFDSGSPIVKGSHYINNTIIDANGEPVVFQEKEVGNKVILSPLNDLEPGKMYTVHIPAGKYKNMDNVDNDEYRFSFYTAKPIKVDLSTMNTPNMWFIDKDLEIDGSSLEEYFLRNKRSIDSFQWDLGDGTVINAKKFTHKYYSEEYYRIILKIKDDKGFEYELEDYISVEPISQVDMSVMVTDKTHNINDTLVIDFNIVLEQNGLPIPGESVRVDLYKEGGLQRTYNVVDTNNKSNYKFTFIEEKGLYAGIYELVFTYDSHGETTVVKEYINIPREVKLYPLILDIYDWNTGMPFSDSNILYVKLNGERYKAYRTEGHLSHYTAKDKDGKEIMLQHGVRYHIELEGWKININNFSISNPSFKQQSISGYPIVPMSKDKAEIVKVSIELPLDHPMNNVYIEGAKINEGEVKIQGIWNDLSPGYYEMKSENGDIFKTYKTDTFKINPSEVLKYGNDLMFRMVANNGIKSPWKYADILIAPQPTIKGKKLNVNVVNREYRLSYPTVFDGVVGGAIDVLKDIPLIDGGNFGIGEGIPAFSGPVYINYYSGLESNMDFEAGFKYDTNKKNTKDTKIDKVKKVTSVGYNFDFNIEGDLAITHYYGDDNWDLPYGYVLMSGNASRKQSSGYSLFGVIGIEAYFTMGVKARGALNMADKTSKSDLSGNITLTPIINGGASGNYGLGVIGGFIELSLPVTMFFPTNIIDVEANIEAKIENVFVGHKEVLLNKKYNAYKWTNRSRSLMRTLLEDEDTIYIESTLLPRDYIGRASNWVANDMTMMRSLVSSESNLSRKSFMENVYPYTDLQLVESNGEKYLVWVDDNPNRDAINRTQLKYSVFDNGEWSKPQWIDDDGTADYTPTVAPMGDGVLMAWHNIGKVLEDEELEDSLYNSEISVTEDVFSPDESPTIITLTDDDKVDHSPKIASNNEMALLVWTKSEGLSFSLNRENKLLAAKNTDSLFFSEWKNGKWSDPKEIAESLPTVVGSNLYMNDSEGLLLYTLDMDNDFSTMEDREIFARIYNGSTWEEAMQITSNNSIDSNPQAVSINNQWFITWIEDGNIKYMESLNGEEKESKFTENIQNNYQLIEGEDLIALVCRTINEQGEQQIGASFYDIDNKTWGDEVILTESGTYSRVFSATFTEDGAISIAYGESKLIKEVVPYGIEGEEYFVEEINISDKVDIKTLDYTPIRDLSISDSDILLSSEIPIPGTMATVYANINNEGDFAEKATVKLYDGDPDLGGRELGEYQTRDYIPARSSREVSIDWLVDVKDESKYDLYLVVSSLNREDNIDNNMASIEILNTDLAILDIQSKHSFKDEYSIEVLLKNNGATPLDNIQLILEDESGKVIETQEIGFLDLLESQYIIFTISSNGLARNQSGEIKIYAKAISTSKEEANLGNNVFQFTILPEKLLVDNLNISQGERSIDIEEKISIGFNKDIDEGRNFDDIVLVDDYLNKVSIESNIEGSILTISPVNRLNYNTNYNLILPNNALKDSFNNVKNHEYRLTFTTVGTNPEIIFAYPGSNMEEVGINSSIELKFNQNVEEGSSFSYIALYDNNSNKVVINKTLKDSTLTINPIGNLKENTTYTLEVPNRAIKNENGEVLNSNYTLIFSTGLIEDKPEDPKEPDEPDYQGGNIGPGYSMDNKYSITTDINGAKKQIKINIINKEAIINLEEYASSIFTSGKNIIVNSPIIPNIDSYRLQISSSLLASEDNKSTLTLNTSIGSITISSAILRDIAIANKGKAEIIFATGNKTKLTNKAKLIVRKYPMINISILVNGKEINYINSNNPVKISIPYKPIDEELENLESIIIWDIDINETILPSGYYDKAAGMVTFTTSKLNNYAVGYNPVKFKDVNVNNWYGKAVSFIAARNITTGTGNGNYSPNAKLTRGQFIVLLMKTYGFNPKENSTNNFVDAGNTYYTAYLSKAKELGISNGIGNNLFAPEKEITRQEMFTMLYNTLNIMGNNLNRDNGRVISDFLDSSEVASWAKEPMDILIRNKIISGSNGRLNPNNMTTRAEIAQVLYNLLYNISN